VPFIVMLSNIVKSAKINQELLPTAKIVVENSPKVSFVIVF